jgi:proteasome accessory factor A
MTPSAEADDERLDPRTGWRRRIYGTEIEFGVSAQGVHATDLVGTEIVRMVAGRDVDVFLSNGGRCYRDVGDHPEYATPECTTLDELVTWETAGLVILDEARRLAAERMRDACPRVELRVFKHNVDTSGHTFGTHENYLVDRSLATRELAAALVPFLVVRPVVCGAGQVVPSWLRHENRAGASWFTISQRAHHLDATISETTTQKRGLINTRDEAHADRNRFRRLHLICGDANMSTASTHLKVGATALALRILETEPSLWPQLTLAEPMLAIRQISDDPELRALVELENGRRVRALDLHQTYLAAVETFAARHGLPPDEERAHASWAETVTDLVTDPDLAADRVDWLAKRRLVLAYADRHRMTPGDDRLVGLDLAYHDIDSDRSLHRRLVDHGVVREVVGRAAVAMAAMEPPATSRARMRGAFVRRACELEVGHRVGWTSLTILDDCGQPVRVVETADPFACSSPEVDDLMRRLDALDLLRTA